MKNILLHKRSLVILDFIAIYLIYILSSYLSNNFSNEDFKSLFFYTILVYTIVKIVIYYVAGNYSVIWKYRIRRSLAKILSVSLIANIGLMIFNPLLLLLPNIYTVLFATMLVATLTEFCYLFISRYFLTWYFEERFEKDEKKKPIKIKNTLIIGAGSAGSMILSEIGLEKEYGYNVVGFMDDDINKIGKIINATTVYGPISNVNQIIDQLKVEEVILAMPSISSKSTQDILDTIDLNKVNVSIVPDKTQLLDGSLHKTLRKVSIDDLLGRDSIELNKSKLEKFIKGKVVLVTGGGGSIGSEICRQVLEHSPKQLIMFDIYENTVYQLKTELDIKYRDEEVKPNYIALIGSVRDKKRLKKVFEEYQPNIVFHAAAHKHVPLMEDSPYEAIKNNIGGTYNVAEACDTFKVDKMVLISTDKAVNPTNVMGSTKRFCEMVVEAWNEKSEHTKYSMVRFGNVLGSNGSVIPLFERQIATGGPLTVTHKEITRFFMTIPEACGLVIESGIYAEGGEKFILDMGQPIKIAELAENMIKLSGLTLGVDIDIVYTGLRPGEKLYEELLLDTSKSTKTPNEKIFIEKTNNPFNLEKINAIIEELTTTSFNSNKDILAILDRVEKEKVERK
ncbi:MAG: nucleoside-diphosphate sugar epimerase/dehydratase [bacterium]